MGTGTAIAQLLSRCRQEEQLEAAAGLLLLLLLLLLQQHQQPGGDATRSNFIQMEETRIPAAASCRRRGFFASSLVSAIASNYKC
jgi:hypothetical protein